MNTREAFLADIIANPADDAVRLIYADWLDDQGEAERAEFIRVQCRLAAQAPCYAEVEHGDWDPSQHQKICGRCFHRRRERELLNSGAEDWCDSPPGTWPSCVDILCWTRGFVSSVTCTAADWLVHADTLTASQPIERVELTTWPEMHRSPHGSFKGDHRVTMFVSNEKYHSACVPQHTPNEIACTILLNAEWSRIAFTLPPTLCGYPVYFVDHVPIDGVSPLPAIGVDLAGPEPDRSGIIVMPGT